MSDMNNNNTEYISKLIDYYGVDQVVEKEVKVRNSDKPKILYSVTMKNGQKFTLTRLEREIVNI